MTKKIGTERIDMTMNVRKALKVSFDVSRRVGTRWSGAMLR